MGAPTGVPFFLFTTSRRDITGVRAGSLQKQFYPVIALTLSLSMQFFNNTVSPHGSASRRVTLSSQTRFSDLPLKVYHNTRTIVQHGTKGNSFFMFSKNYTRSSPTDDQLHFVCLSCLFHQLCAKNTSTHVLFAVSRYNSFSFYKCRCWPCI